jgi:hypothetical protein
MENPVRANRNEAGERVSCSCRSLLKPYNFLHKPECDGVPNISLLG